MTGSVEQSYVPRYVEIQRALRTRIAGMAAGEKLPSDAELCEEFQVSRMTARLAVRSLVDEGLIMRMRGRGSYVTRPPVRRQMGSLLSFSEEMRRRGLAPSSRLLNAGLEPPTDVETMHLELGPGAQVVVVRRLRLGNETPMSIERAALRLEYRAVLDHDLDRGSLYDALRRLGHDPTVATGTLTVGRADDAEAELLEVDSGASLLVERRVVRDQHDRPVEFTESRYVADRYVFDIELRATDA